MPRKGPIRRREEGGNLDHDLTMFTCDAVSSHNHSPQHSWLTNGLDSTNEVDGVTHLTGATPLAQASRMMRVFFVVTDGYRDV